MTYSAMIRKSHKNGKWMYFLSRDGRTCFIADASYLSRESAIGAARRKTQELANKVSLPVLAGNIKFQVSK